MTTSPTIGILQNRLSFQSEICSKTCDIGLGIILSICKHQVCIACAKLIIASQALNTTEISNRIILIPCPFKKCFGGFQRHEMEYINNFEPKITS